MHEAGEDLAIPQYKFVMEVITGILATGHCIRTRITAALKGNIATKNTLRQLQRMLVHE